MPQSDPEDASFVPYLPQDNADSEQSEQLITALSTAFEGLLKAPAGQFWQRIKAEAAIKLSIGSYLQFCRRDQDNGSDGTVPSATRRALAKNVFLVIFRLVSREPGSLLAAKDQRQLLYNSRIVDLPRLLDVAALYTGHNLGLCHELIQQSFSLEPRFTQDVEKAVPVITGNIDEVQMTCMAQIERLGSSHSSTSFQGLADGLAYLWDACATLAGFCEAHPPAASLFLARGGFLPSTIAAIHGQLIPQATKIWAQTRRKPSEGAAALQVQRSLYSLERDASRLLFVLIDCAFLRIPEGQAGPSSSSRPFDPASRGRGAGVLEALQSCTEARRLLKLLQSRFGLDGAISAAIQQGWLFLDAVQQDLVFAILGSSQTSAENQEASQKAANAAKAAEREAQLRQIREVLPGYGDGFLAACLDAAGQNAERVIHQLLEGALPAELKMLDPQMPLGITGEHLQIRPSPTTAGRETAADSGRAQLAQLSGKKPQASVHKGTAYALQTTQQDASLAKFYAQAAQWEYDDEYDDSFDDLAAFEADSSAETQGDRVEDASKAPKTASQATLKGGKALWVLNGRIYNYRKEGATPVANPAAAEEAVRAQQAAEIHGLGAGGNRPAVPPRGGGDSQDRPEGSGGRGRGRGGRHPPPDARRAQAFKSEHKASIANHHRKDRALRKAGGPAP